MPPYTPSRLLFLFLTLMLGTTSLATAGNWGGNDSLRIGPLSGTTYCKTFEKVLIAPDFQVFYTNSFDLEGAQIYFSEGYIRDDDQLSLPFNPSGLFARFEPVTGVFTIRGKAPIETYVQLIQSIQYSNTNKLTDIRDKEVTVVLGNKLFNPENGHYYTLVQKNQAVSWIQARDQAAADSYLGLQGYLVTINTKQENDFIKSLIASNSWLGGTDTGTEGVWRWVTGCEAEADMGAGLHFSQQNIPNAGLPANNQYNNWACAEPNDCCAGEDYLHMIGPEYPYCGNFGEWNDLPAFDGTVKSFIIEYGCGESLDNFKPWATLPIYRLPPHYGYVAASSCESYFWEGNTLTSTNVYRFPAEGGQECDSIVELDLIIYPAVQENITFTTDMPYFWEASGELYRRSGIYTAQLLSEQGCDSTVVLNLEILKPNNYYVPNIFTPNADGDNDFFTIYGNENLQTIARLQIFDRWGNLVFDRSNLPPNQPESGWGGAIEQPAGLYLFAAELAYRDGERKSVSGSVVLLR